ncbi:MAG: hypothetical protein JEZ08_07215 [Clostridiales bacterium]|nr:hypothetical protein [Clostridiales bacterium]
MISLGIDTSCYTTSLVVMDGRTIVYEGRKLLDVKKGTVGLRQADAFFQHVQNLPNLYESLVKVVDVKNLSRVVVSTRPRPVEHSYMPVFLAGENFARIIAATLNIPLLPISHQENHLYAVLYETEIDENFIGVHISGGTSEILKVSHDKGFDISIIGQTLDLSFGKLIDRIGVYMGLDFPCGKVLDTLKDESSYYPLKMSIKSLDFNISGIENQLKAYYDKDKNMAKIAYTLFRYIGQLLIKILEKSLEQTGYEKIVLSGGVSANTVIRKVLSNRFNDSILFTSIEYATDHSVGNAYYGNVVKTY